jgi:hypothetical protein
VIRHDDIGVEFVVSRVSILNRLHHSAGDVWHAERARAGSSRIENTIHCQKGLSGSVGRREAAICREAARETPSEEDRLADGMIVRKPTAMKAGHKVTVSGFKEESRADCQSATG